MPGVELPPKENLCEMALMHAAGRHKRDISSMEILKIDATAIKPKTTYESRLPAGPSSRNLRPAGPRSRNDAPQASRCRAVVERCRTDYGVRYKQGNPQQAGG